MRTTTTTKQEAANSKSRQQQQHQCSISAQSTQSKDQHETLSQTSTVQQGIQGQPLQARSSNSGTSVKRSDNISQSSYPVGDVSSDRAHTVGKANAQSSSFQLIPGQLTSAFQAQKHGGEGAAHTAISTNQKDNSKRAVGSRRVAVVPDEQETSTHGNAGGTAKQQTQSQQNSGVATRAAIGGRLTRSSASTELRAVKQDSAQSANPALPAERSSSGQKESLLKPIKQAQSEQGTMRTTRSKAKANALTTATGPSDRPRVPPCNGPAQNSNGQSEAESGNLEKFGNAPVQLRVGQRSDLETGPGLRGEENKQASPRSINSSIIGVGVEKVGNQSFQINDSTDSVMENPLTTVIKQFQNLRTSAQLTGVDKPTIQQFLEKFEHEMQYLEDQYQTQQQAREEQMRLFEQHYGTAVVNDDPFGLQGQPSGSACLNDQQCGAGAASSFKDDTMMVQDTQTPCMMGDQSNNSFNSALHGPNTQPSVFASDHTQSEIYESFHFQANSMLSFYPRQVRRILTRRKTANSVNTTISELSGLKAPKHRTKIAKNLSKMHGLAVCQMNMMQILLQKISRRSKVIRKQEKIVNENLKRKRIYLERENFDLMSFLRNSLEAAESQIQANPAPNAMPQKGKQRTTSDFNTNSHCPSTAGTKSGIDAITQSVKESTTAQNFGEELSLIDGFNSRKPASGRHHCQSQSESLCQPSQLVQAQNSSDEAAKAAQTPEPPAAKVIAEEDQTRMQRAEAKMNQALHLSEIQGSFTHIGPSKQNMKAEAESGAHQMHGAIPANFYSQDELYENQSPMKIQAAGIQQPSTEERAQNNQSSKLAQMPPVRKMQSTQSKRTKRKSELDVRAQVPTSCNLLAKLTGEQGDEGSSFAIADLNAPHMQTQHLPDGKIALTLKVNERPSESGQIRTQNGAKQAENSRKSRRKPIDKINQPNQSRNQANRVASVPDAQNKFEDYGRVEGQRKLSPLQDTVDNHVSATDGQTNGQPFVQHSAFLETQEQAAMGHFDAAGFYPGYELLPEGMDMQEADHFMMGAGEPQHRHQSGIFNEFIKAEDHHAHHHDQGAYAHQPLDQENQLAAIALHRSQSVMLPQTHHQMGVLYGNGLMEAHPSLVPSNLGAASFEQFTNQYQQQAHQPGRTARSKRESGKTTNQMMDPFFDESAQELSSIDHSHANAAAENYVEHHQMGYNPYEQAKRQALKQQSSVDNVRSRKESQAPAGLFVSPMGADMHTPQGKQEGPGGRAVPMIMIGQEGTPSHFMSGVEVGADRQMAHGHHGEHLQPHNNHHHHQAQQLSVGRMYGADPLGMSAGYPVDGRQDVSGAGNSIAMHHPEHDLSNMRGTFGNTPSHMLGAHHGDPHRQNLGVSVSGWNLDDQVVVQGQQPRAAARAEPIYQGMPDAYM